MRASVGSSGELTSREKKTKICTKTEWKSKREFHKYSCVLRKKFFVIFNRDKKIDLCFPWNDNKKNFSQTHRTTNHTHADEEKDSFLKWNPQPERMLSFPFFFVSNSSLLFVCDMMSIVWWCCYSFLFCLRRLCFSKQSRKKYVDFHTQHSVLMISSLIIFDSNSTLYVQETSQICVWSLCFFFLFFVSNFLFFDPFVFWFVPFSRELLQKYIDGFDSPDCCFSRPTQTQNFDQTSQIPFLFYCFL